MDKRVITKWESIIESMFNIKNRTLLEHICNFCEWRSILGDTAHGTSASLPEKLLEIKENINNYEEIRIEVVGRYFNKLTGILEYKLTDGTYINGNLPIYEISDKDIMSILGNEYLKYYNLSSYRDMILNKIV